MNNVRTVSDTKRNFYTVHTRPINSIYRRVVEELMVEMHLLSVNVDFHYDPIYALGVVSSFDRFMQGYRPDPDKTSIFNALCQALGADPQKYRQDAEQLQALAAQMSPQELTAPTGQLASLPGGQMLQETLQAIAANPKFKYSRLFAIGLFTLLETADPELVKDEKQRTEFLKQVSAQLHLPEDKVQKDLELYRSNLEKMVQAQAALQDILNADRKQREQRAQAKGEASVPSDAPKDEAPSA
ncbi:MAG TPA: photosystem II biogenesis protein Psp29 [Allocoleopsis sp.]